MLMLGRSLPLLALVVAMLVAGAVPARSHPHVWVEVKAELVWERGTFTGLRQTWVFDELYTAQALDGLPAAKDGSYGRAELAELTKANMDGLKEFNYFTIATLAGKQLAFADPSEAFLEHIPVPRTVAANSPSVPAAPAPAAPPAPPAEPPGFWTRVWNSLMGKPSPAPAAPGAVPAGPKTLALTFTLPFTQPVLADAEGFEFIIADASLFIWLEPAKSDPFKLSAGAPKTCTIGFKPENAAKSAEEKRLGDAFGSVMGQAGSVAAGPRPIVARCAG